QRQNAQHGIVEIAEATGAAGPAVMGAAGRTVDDAAFAQQLDRLERAAAGSGRPAEDLGKHWVAVAPDVVALAPLRRHIPVHVSSEMVAIMKARQLLRRRPRAVDILPLVRPSHGADQVERRRHPRDRQRVPVPVGRGAIDLAADEIRPARHTGSRFPTSVGRNSITVGWTYMMRSISL